MKLSNMEGNHMEVNSKWLKVSSTRVEIPDDLVFGEYDVTVTVKGDIVKVENLDQQDGTFDVVYVLKPLEMEVHRP